MPKLYIKNSRYFKYLMTTMAVITAVVLIILFSIRYSFATVFITVCVVILAVSCILEAVILIIAAIYELIQLIKKPSESENSKKGTVMSYITSLYVCHEIIVDSNNNFISEHETNLPHAELISKTFCEQFDRAAEDYLLNIMNNELGNRIALLKAMPSKARNETIISIRITAKPGVRFTSKLRNAVYDFMSSQFSDGWGEGFFGPANIITANDGTRFYID